MLISKRLRTQDKKTSGQHNSLMIDLILIKNMTHKEASFIFKHPQIDHQS